MWRPHRSAAPLMPDRCCTAVVVSAAVVLLLVSCWCQLFWMDAPVYSNDKVLHSGGRCFAIYGGEWPGPSFPSVNDGCGGEAGSLQVQFVPCVRNRRSSSVCPCVSVCRCVCVQVPVRVCKVSSRVSSLDFAAAVSRMCANTCVVCAGDAQIDVTCVTNAAVVDCDLDRTNWWRFFNKTDTSAISEMAMLLNASSDVSAVDSDLVATLLRDPRSVDAWCPPSLTPSEKAGIWQNRCEGGWRLLGSGLVGGARVWRVAGGCPR